MISFVHIALFGLRCIFRRLDSENFTVVDLVLSPNS